MRPAAPRAKASVGRGGWLPWVEANLSFGERQAQKYMRLAEHADQIRTESSDLTINQALALLSPAKDLRRGHLTGQVEWYTPPTYLDSARQVMGGFDVDPASSQVAQEQVRATSYFTRDDDGLAQPWTGKVWCNPPYCDADKFVDKLLAEIKAGRTTEAVLLVNAYSDTRWFHKAAHAAAAICFTLGRIRFETPDRQPQSQPPHGSALMYFGSQLDRFRVAFAGHGLIMVRIP
jgi:phage N-6-adenine-methyltransferase